MLEIHFIDRTEQPGQSIPVVNGIVDRLGRGYGVNPNEGVFFSDSKVVSVIRSSSFAELSSFVSTANFNTKIGDFEAYCTIDVKERVPYHLLPKEYAFRPIIEFKIEVNPADWLKPYTIRQFARKFYDVIEHNPLCSEYGLYDDHYGADGLSIAIPISDMDAQIDIEVSAHEAVVEYVLNTASAELLGELDGDVITTLFSFPEELKIPCKQYLVYFAQFLGDLGISAETEIREELHETLFRIIPKDKNESLQRIREALDIFLNLPGIQNPTALLPSDGGIATMQLQAQVSFLQSQLQLAHAVSQAKDAAIQSQSISIDSLRLSLYELRNKQDSRSVVDKPSDEEQIVGRFVTVKPATLYGITVNSPEIARKVKEILGRLRRR